MIDGDDEVQHEGADAGQRDPCRRDDCRGADQDQRIEAELKIARTQAVAFLQIERENVRPAESRAMAKQNEQAEPRQRPADDRRIERRDRIDD